MAEINIFRYFVAEEPWDGVPSSFSLQEKEAKRIVHTFKKEERLCNVKEIEQLFTGASASFVKYPLRVVYCKGDGVNKILISVPKKRFKHAVDRNRIKRLVREAYRLNKHNLAVQDLHIGFVYIDAKLSDYQTIERSVIGALKKIADECRNS